MWRDFFLTATLCLLVSLLAVAMATEDKSGQGSLPPEEGDQRQSSPKLGPEHVQGTAGSNSSGTAAGKGHIHILLSLSHQKEHVLKPSVSGSEDGSSQMPPDTSHEEKPSGTIVSPYDPDQDRGRLLVAVARTLVTSTASTTTVTVLSTCHNGAFPAPVCGRRKKKRQVAFSPASETVLDSSIESEPVLPDKPVERAGRLILWSSSITTVLFTATSTRTTGIVTAVYQCSFAAIVMCG